MADSFIERISLCKVTKRRDKNDKDQLQLTRIADVEGGILKEFRLDKGKPMSFDNRDRLFWNDGPDVEGAFGIWRWSAVPHEKYYTKDYIGTNYVEDLQAIEIIRIHSATTIEKLLEMMTGDGLEIAPVGKRFLLCPHNNIGLLCSDRDFSEDSGRFILKDSVNCLPLYSFDPNDTITIDDKKFYTSLECGEPVRMVLTKNPMELVREVILRRILPAKVKSLDLPEMTKNRWKEIRAFITGLPVNSVYQEIQAVCFCSEEEAKSYVDSFLSQADKYIGHEDCDGIILSIREHCPKLREQIEAAISKAWHEANQGKIDAAEENIEALKRELDAKNKELQDAKRSLEEVQKLIQSHEQLAEEVSVKVQKRISDARKDAADFIAEMAFMRPNCEHHAPIFYSPGKDCGSDDMEYVDEWREAIDILSSELPEAGVATKYARNFAAFLYSAYVNRVPILLAGPNAEDIADAFSVSLFGKTAGVADCSVPYFPEFEHNITGGNDNVFLVKHAFRSEWITHIPDFQKSGSYCFIAHPFAEDLVIEPRSLFSYVLPVLTEMIVDSAPKRNYIGAKRSESFEEYQPHQLGQVHTSLLKSFGFTSYAGSRAQAVLDDFHVLAGSEDREADCLFVVFPYAFITDRNRESLLDRLSDSLEINRELRKELAAFMGELDE